MERRLRERQTLHRCDERELPMLRRRKDRRERAFKRKGTIKMKREEVNVLTA